MSRRTAEASKAVALAWANEQQRVKEGKGTRDWTPDQQKDILERGKAYDENGRAFEGQHMKSVEKYPEYQGDPDNIQFLTKEEHLAAHQGNWQNPTNWYYNPVTKEYLDFGDGAYIPCTVIDLSEPIMIESVPKQKSDSGRNEPEINDIPETPQSEKKVIHSNKEVPPKKTQIPLKTMKAAFSKIGDGISYVGDGISYIKDSLIKFAAEHPFITLAVVTASGVAIDKAVGGGGSGSNAQTSGGGLAESSSSKSDGGSGSSNPKSGEDALSDNDDNLEDDINIVPESEDVVNEPSDDCSSEEKTPQTKCPHETKGYKRIRNGKEENVRGYVTGQNRKKSDDN